MKVGLSYWHSTIMTQKALAPSEVIDFADHHSGTMAMQRTRINPYKLGIELLRDIEALEHRPIRQGVRRLRRPRQAAKLG